MIEEENPVRKKNISRYCQDFNNEESKDFDEEVKQRPKKKETKFHSETIRRSVYYQNCYNERHLRKKCKLLNKFSQICKQSDCNTNQCPSKVVFGRCPREIVPMHVVQAEGCITIYFFNNQFSCMFFGNILNI